METVFYCADCNKFFYAESSDNPVSAVCGHCSGTATITCQTKKESYTSYTFEQKNNFKAMIRERYPNKAVLLEKVSEMWQQIHKRKQIEAFKLTTGFDFQGYVITEYIDVLFDEMLVGLGIGRSFVSSLDNFFSAVTGTEATAMIDKLNEIKYDLKSRLVSKAIDLGANAMLGIDFESSKLGDLIMVSMTGTAVKIKKAEDQTDQEKDNEQNKTISN